MLSWIYPQCGAGEGLGGRERRSKIPVSLVPRVCEVVSGPGTTVTSTMNHAHDPLQADSATIKFEFGGDKAYVRAAHYCLAPPSGAQSR